MENNNQYIQAGYSVGKEEAEEEIKRLQSENERLREALIDTQIRVDTLECECDPYNGFTCGLHEWKDEINQALRSTLQ